LAELPQTLDETYDRILSAIPRDYHDFARTALAILAAQSELGDRTLTAEVLLAMVLRSLGIGADHFYDIYDIREFCGCRVTFVPARTYDRNRLHQPLPPRLKVEDVTEVFMAHYTVKEFLYAERTARKSENYISSFALQEQAVIDMWAELVMEVAIRARPSDRMISYNSMEDYCVATGCHIIKAGEDKIISNSRVVSHCLDFLDPAAPHHSRLSTSTILQVKWYSPPANPRIAALAECCVQKLWLLATAVLEELDAQQIIETSVMIKINEKRSTRHGPR
jgi:hypothetical protein